MKRLILVVVLLLPSLVFAAEYEKWAMLKDGKIIKFKTIKSDDMVVKPKLIAHNYVLVKESVIPNYSMVEETITSKYKIEFDKVVRVYTIIKKSAVEIKDIKTRMAEEQAVSDFKKLLSISIEAIDTKPLLDMYKQQLTEIKELAK